MKYYISGKITGIEKEAYNLFKTAENFLIANGHEVINPMDLPHDHDKTWCSYMKDCIKALCECDAIYMLKNWTDSRGAKMEIDIAIKLELKMTYE